MNYSELTLRYFRAAPGAGVLAHPTAGRGAAGGVGFGTWVQFDIEVGEGTICDARYLAFGCPHTIAVAAWLVEQAVGGAARASLPESVEQLERRFEIPAAKRGRILIIEDAWTAAMTAALRR